MLINQAYAAEAPTTTTQTGTAPQMPAAPSSGEAFAWNMGMVLILVIMFYFLLILPQQRRFREHSQMLSGLKKGDKVVTGGGLIGVIDKIGDSDEVVVDLGNGVKVSALRHTITGRDDPHKRKAAANDQKKALEAKKDEQKK